MKVYWDFTIENASIQSSGDLLFDDIPRFISSASLYSADDSKAIEKLIGFKINCLQVTGTDGYKYSLYKCRIISIENNFTQSCIIAQMTILFEMVIQQNSADCKYSQCSFTFDHIEELFPLESFDSEFSAKNDSIVFKKEINKMPFENIGEGISFKVESHFNGVYKSNTLFQLNVTQTKRIYLCWDTEKDVDSIISTIYKIKQYFELVIHNELHIKDIKLSDENYKNNSKLVYSTLNKSNNSGTLKIENKYQGTYNDIIIGLRGWIEKFDMLQTGIKLWLKQIYNTHIDRSDIILWNCQVIEYIGESIGFIKTDAQAIMDERTGKLGVNPNLFAFLKAINNRYKYFTGLDESYFSDAKEVRNKVTHNNPEKSVTERQLKNTEILMKNWSVKLICSVINLKGMSSSTILIPKSEE